MIFPNEKAVREGYKQWCEMNGQNFDEEIFRDYYQETTFDYYNYIWKR